MFSTTIIYLHNFFLVCCPKYYMSLGKGNKTTHALTCPRPISYFLDRLYQNDIALMEYICVHESSHQSLTQSSVPIYILFMHSMWWVSPWRYLRQWFQFFQRFKHIVYPPHTARWKGLGSECLPFITAWSLERHLIFLSLSFHVSILTSWTIIILKI